MTNNVSTVNWRDPATFGRDFLASVVVFLVALPLCMGIAIASGMPPAAGIVSGIIGGLVVGTIGGCPLQVTGPAAGLTVIVFDLIREHGMEKLGVILMIGGLFQLIAGFSGLARWFRAVPPSVINGMLSGIGVLIFASQFHIMVDDSPKGSGLQNLISIPVAVWKGLVADGNLDTSHHIAAPIGLLTIVVLLIWEKAAVGKMKLLPGSLIAVLTATVVAAVMQLPIKYVNLPSVLTDVLRFPTWDAVKAINLEIVMEGIAVGFIAAAETLLTAAALDKMAKTRTNYDRELTAQGVGNTLCGFLGVLPVTGVMVRSGVNYNAGAKTRRSAVMHGAWLLIFVACLPFLVKMIPTASLAALLVYTGWKLANFKVIKQLAQFGKAEVAIYFLTLSCIVGVDLLTGVLVGVALSVAKLLYIFSHLDIRIADDSERRRTEIWLRGAATFLSLPKLAAAIEEVSGDREMHIHLEGLEYIDHACLDLLMSWDKAHSDAGGSLVIDWGTLGNMYKERRRANRGEAPTTEFRKLSPFGGGGKSASSAEDVDDGGDSSHSKSAVALETAPEDGLGKA